MSAADADVVKNHNICLMPSDGDFGVTGKPVRGTVLEIQNPHISKSP